MVRPLTRIKFMEKQEKLLKPAQFTEQKLITAIVNGDWKTGGKLPPERELSDLLGVTRPTLREVLQRLSRDGWITIKHGRPTIVNDYKNNGGLGVLKSLINYEGLTSATLIHDWLEFRVLVMPTLALKAIKSNADEILDMLNNAPDISVDSRVFSIFDWDLQMLMIKKSNNSIAIMLYNDLTEIYHKKGEMFFADKQIKSKSIDYYKKLKEAIEKNSKDIVSIIEQTMQNSLEIWERVNHYNT